MTESLNDSKESSVTDDEFSVNVPCSGSNLNDMGLVWYDGLSDIFVESIDTPLKNVTLWCGITKLCTAVLQTPGKYAFTHDCKMKPMKFLNTAYFETRGPLQLFYSPVKTNVKFSCKKLIFPMKIYRKMLDYYYLLQD